MNEKYLIGLWMVTLFASGMFFQASAQTVIQLKPEGVVMGQWILLGEIADIHGTSSEIGDELRRLPLGPTPAEGKQLLVTRYDIIHHLRKNNFDTRLIDIQGAPRSTVHQPGEWVHPDTLSAAAHEYIKSYYNVDPGDLLIEDKRLPDAMLLPSGPLEFQIILVSGGPQGGTVSLQCNLIQNGIIRESVRLTFQVRIFGDALVAQDFIEKGSVIENTQFQETRMELTRLPRDLILDPGQLEGMHASRAIRSGEFLTERLLEKPLLIRRGQLVNLRINREGLTMSVSGKALENGFAGETIRAQNLDTGRIVQGQVMNADILLIPSF